MRFPAGIFGLASLAALAACGESTPKDPAEAQIARLTGQGFSLISDGHASGGPAVLQYQGSPAAVITCAAGGGRAAATDQSGTATSSDGAYVVTQTGQVAAYVIVDPTGGLRGTYINTLSRQVTTSGGAPVATELETIAFAPGSVGSFRNGLTCQALS